MTVKTPKDVADTREASLATRSEALANAIVAEFAKDNQAPGFDVFVHVPGTWTQEEATGAMDLLGHQGWESPDVRLPEHGDGVYALLRAPVTSNTTY